MPATNCMFRRRDAKRQLSVTICNVKRIDPKLARALMDLADAAFKELERGAPAPGDAEQC